VTYKLLYFLNTIAGATPARRLTRFK